MLTIVGTVAQIANVRSLFWWDCACVNRKQLWYYSISLGNASMNSSTWDILPVDTYTDSSDDDQSMGTIDIGQTGQQKQNKVSIRYTQGDIGGPRTGLTESLVFAPRGYLENPSTDFSATGYIG